MAARNRWPRQGKGVSRDTSSAGAESRTRAEDRITPTGLDECLRACAVHSGKLVAGLDPRRNELAEKLRALLASHATAHAAQAAKAPAPAGGAAAALLRRGTKAGTSTGTALDADLLDALLAVGNKALECGYDDELKLARLVGDTVLTQRKGSRAGWRLRARILEATGDEIGAIKAYERYLELTENDGFAVAPRNAGLRAARQHQAELLALLQRECPTATLYADGPATDVWAEGLARYDSGDRDGAEPRLVGALLAMAADEDSPVQDLQQCLGQYLDLRIGERSPHIAALREHLALYAEQRRNRMRGPVDDPTYAGVNWLTLGEFRNQIAGKSICLIANSQRVGHSSLGPEIDAYDLVVRFNSYRIDAPATGSRTDIHVSIHKHSFNWEKRVTTRLIFGGLPNDWRYSMRTRLVPGAQSYVGDDSLRWPVRNIGGIGTDAWPSIPTSGFNMLWLLDFLDVSPKLDLIGFDFYESGAYRISEAMRMPITSVHEYTSEKAWVMERAQSVTDARISLR